MPSAVESTGGRYEDATEYNLGSKSDDGIQEGRGREGVCVSTRPETNSSLLKYVYIYIYGWKTSLPFGMAHFQGRNVSFWCFRAGKKELKALLASEIVGAQWCFCSEVVLSPEN